MPVYDEIGKGYDSTRKADPYLASRIASHLRIDINAKYLDVACGTGNYTTMLQTEYGGNWSGIDASALMIRAAREKCSEVDWLVGECGKLPHPANTFSGIICTLAIHHFTSLNLIFGEVARVLNRGRFVILTATPEQMRHYWLCEYFPEAMLHSMKQMPSLEKVTKALNEVGLEIVCTEPYEIQIDLQDFFLYSGKHLPTMYLDPAVRAGISTFALLADRTEVEQGCQRLAADIQSGRIAEIQSSYAHKAGDYLFIAAAKS